MKKTKALKRKKPLAKKSKKTKKRKSRANPIKVKTLDDLWSKVIRTRDGYKCVRCGSQKQPQGSHIIPRTVRVTRWDILNGKCLCWRCHDGWWHQHPIEAVEWAEKYFGEDRIEYLKQKSQQIGIPVDRQEVLAYLKKKLKEYGGVV